MGNRNLRYVIVCLAVLISGCPNRYSYQDNIAEFKAQGSTSIAVTTSDQREYILSGNKKPDFAGLVRDGWGIPIDVRTASGKPLAEEMTQSIATSFEKKGFKPIPVTVAHTENRQIIIDKLKKTNAEHFFVFTLTEWKSDTMNSISLAYDVTAEVLDREGKTLARKAVNERAALVSKSWDPRGYAEQAVRDSFKATIEKLLNSPDFEAALR